MALSLALDFGTQTGFALYSDRIKGSVGSMGSWTLLGPKEKALVAKSRGRSLDPRVPRLFEKLKTLESLGGGPVLRVAFEDVRFSSSMAQGQLWSALRATAWTAFPRATWKCVPTGTLKSFATGCGNAEKPQMLAALPRRYREMVEFFGHDDNAVDAFWVGRWAGYMEQDL